MPVPDNQSCMLPLMRLARDGREYTFAEVVEALAGAFQLTEDDRRELLPSGGQPRFENRVGWAKSKLQKAGLLEATGRARFRISPRGITVMRVDPPAINDKFLLQFPEFVAFKRGPLQQAGGDERRTGDTIAGAPVVVPPTRDTIDVSEVGQTPEEMLEASYQELRRDLALELLERVKRSPPRFFERLVVDLLVAMGYGGSRKDAGQAIGASGDEGIDGIINEDRLGLDVVYLQAKRWEGTVGRPTIQAFAGSLDGQRARKGVFITTSQFSREARDYVAMIEKKIVLVDGEQLAQLMMNFGVGVTEVATYTVKRVDSDFFGDE